MTSTAASRPARNGVDVPTLFATLDAVKAQPEIARVPVPGPQRVDQRHPQPHAPSRASTAPGQEDTSRTEPFTYDADHPAVLVGTQQRADRRWSSCCTRSPPA